MGGALCYSRGKTRVRTRSRSSAGIPWGSAVSSGSRIGKQLTMVTPRNVRVTSVTTINVPSERIRTMSPTFNASFNGASRRCQCWGFKALNVVKGAAAEHRGWQSAARLRSPESFG